MRVTRPRRRSGRCKYRVLCGFCGAIFAAASVATAVAADDAYLELLDREATKVERVPTDTAGDGGAGSDRAEQRPVAQARPSRDHFEALLQHQHVGTYSFYRKLPERSREEIFLDYGDGASMEALREKIVDRYLHP